MIDHQIPRGADSRVAEHTPRAVDEVFQRVLRIFALLLVPEDLRQLIAGNLPIAVDNKVLQKVPHLMDSPG